MGTGVHTRNDETRSLDWGWFPDPRRTQRARELMEMIRRGQLFSADLTELLANLRAEGVDVNDRTEDSECGTFAWLADRKATESNCG
jgi:hypothetical protein